MEAQPEMKPQPSDQITPSPGIGTPQKLPNLPRRFNHHRRPQQLPDKYELILGFFDALVASLKLLRLRKSIPFFSKIRVIIEKISERRFTHQHLAQLKFLLPEMEVKRVLLQDEDTRCMKYDLQLTFNTNMMIDTKKRKRESKYLPLRDCFISRLLQFLSAHPEGTEIPEEELPEPFSSRKQAPMSYTTELSCSSSYVQTCCDPSLELETTHASHFSTCFRKHFSNPNEGSKSGIDFHSPPASSLQSPSASVSNSSMNEVLSKEGVKISKIKAKTPIKSAATPSRLVPSTPTLKTPIKSAGTPSRLVPSTPTLKTPKMRSLSPDEKVSTSPNEVAKRPSCAKSLCFESSSMNVCIELQVDDDESSDILDILPANLIQSLKKKERTSTEQPKRKQMMANLPKLIDRIYYMFQRPKYSAITKETLISDLTERHWGITDESEVEQQLTILQEIIPDWISLKLSPSGKSVYCINKAFNLNSLHLRLDNAM